MNMLTRTSEKLIQSVWSSTVLSRFNSFKSAIALEKLYPESTLKLNTPKPPDNCEFYIPLDQLEISYSKSSGPGGQNVNKVNTKVDVRFKVSNATWLKDDLKQKLAEKYEQKLTKDGYLIFKSDLTRSQQLNLADCLEKIRNCLRKSIEKEPEISLETQEKIRRRIERAAKERLLHKRARSSIKNDRQSYNIEL